MASRVRVEVSVLSKNSKWQDGHCLIKTTGVGSTGMGNNAWDQHDADVEPDALAIATYWLVQTSTVCPSSMQHKGVLLQQSDHFLQASHMMTDN